MHLNEAAGFVRRSNLTKEQRREAELAVYGYPKDFMPQQNQPTREELEHMRQILARFGETKTIKEFDLNKPPAVPYRHQEFPKAMHDHTARVVKTATSAAHQAELEAAGYVTVAFASEPPEVELDASERAEAAAIDARLLKKKRS